MTDITTIALIRRLDTYIKQCPDKKGKTELIKTQEFFINKLFYTSKL